MYIAVVLNSGNILESRLVNKSFSLDEEFLHIPEEDFVVLIFFWIVRIFAVEKNMDQFILTLEYACLSVCVSVTKRPHLTHYPQANTLLSLIHI